MKAFLPLAFLALASCGPTDKPVEQSTTKTAAAPAAAIDVLYPHQERVASLHRYYREIDSSQTVMVATLRELHYHGLAYEQKTAAAELSKAKTGLDQLDKMLASKSTDDAEFARLLDVVDNAVGQAKGAGMEGHTGAMLQQMDEKDALKKAAKSK